MSGGVWIVDCCLQDFSLAQNCEWIQVLSTPSQLIWARERTGLLQLLVRSKPWLMSMKNALFQIFRTWLESRMMFFISFLSSMSFSSSPSPSWSSWWSCTSAPRFPHQEETQEDGLVEPQGLRIKCLTSQHLHLQGGEDCSADKRLLENSNILEQNTRYNKQMETKPI